MFTFTNACENSDVIHNCTQDCIRLLELMDGGYDDGATYDPTGTSYRESEYFGTYEGYVLHNTATGTIVRQVTVEPDSDDYLDYYNDPHHFLNAEGNGFIDKHFRNDNARNRSNYWGDWSKSWFAAYNAYVTR